MFGIMVDFELKIFAWFEPPMEKRNVKLCSVLCCQLESYCDWLSCNSTVRSHLDLNFRMFVWHFITGCGRFTAQSLHFLAVMFSYRGCAEVF